MNDDRAPPPLYGDLFDSDYVGPLSVLCGEDGDNEETDLELCDNDESEDILDISLHEEGIVVCVESVDDGDEGDNSGNNTTEDSSEDGENSTISTHDHDDENDEDNEDGGSEHDFIGDSEEFEVEEGEVEEEGNDVNEDDTDRDETMNTEDGSEATVEPTESSEQCGSGEEVVPLNSMVQDDYINSDNDDSHRVEPSAPLSELAPPTYDHVLCHTQSDSAFTGLGSDVIDPPMYHDFVSEDNNNDRFGHLTSIGEDSRGIMDDCGDDGESVISQSPPEYHEAVTTLVLSGLSPQPSAPTVSEIERSHASIGFNDVGEHVINTSPVFPPFDPTVDDQDQGGNDPDDTDAGSMERYRSTDYQQEVTSVESNNYERSLRIKRNINIILHLLMALIPLASAVVILSCIYFVTDCSDKMDDYICAVSEDQWVCERIVVLLVVGAIGLIVSLALIWNVKYFYFILVPVLVIILILGINVSQYRYESDKYTEETSKQILEEMKQCHGGDHMDKCWSYFKNDFCQDWMNAEYVVCSEIINIASQSIGPPSRNDNVTKAMQTIQGCTDTFAYYVDDVYDFYMDQIMVTVVFQVVSGAIVLSIVAYIHRYTDKCVMWRLYNEKPCRKCPCGEKGVINQSETHSVEMAYIQDVDTTDEMTQNRDTTI